MVCKATVRRMTHLELKEIAEITQFVEAEEAEARVGAAEVFAFPSSKEPVPAAEEAEDDGQMDALDEGEQTGISPEL